MEKKEYQSSYTSNACNQIGLAFEQGFGVPVDLQKALEWYYMGNQCSFNTVKLHEQGFTLSPQEKIMICTTRI
jgi:hypothetical protein